VSKDVTITISAAGDVTLSSDIKQPAGVNFFSVYNKQKDASYFFKNVRTIFDSDDLSIINFEGTLSNRGSRVEKQWAFRGKPSYINILKEGSVEAVSFANNHVRDYGEVSYSDTAASFEKANIAYSSYSQVGIYEVKGIKIGMISIQETGRYDYEATLRAAIKAMKKKKPDLVIVSFHWGIERTSYATKSQVKLSRIAIDEGGADLVLGHHPHVLQPIEKYKDAYIVYSLGNFCFGGNTNPPDKDTMIYQQTFSFHNDKLVPDDEVSMIPCSVSSVSNKNDYQPTPSVGSEKKRILKKMNGYCKQYNLSFDKNGKLITE
jgi:poly-gamma-glutamate synthesis protein (capsule biosynthesis protein)